MFLSVLCALLLLLCLIGTILDMIMQAFNDISKQNISSSDQMNNIALQLEAPVEGALTEKGVNEITEDPPAEIRTTFTPPAFFKSK